MIQRGGQGPQLMDGKWVATCAPNKTKSGSVFATSVVSDRQPLAPNAAAAAAAAQADERHEISSSTAQHRVSGCQCQANCSKYPMQQRAAGGEAKGCGGNGTCERQQNNVCNECER